MVSSTNSTATSWLPIITIVLIPLIFVCGLLAPPGWNWGLVMFFMIVFVLVLGQLKTKSPFGIFINERNKMSLSRFQTVIWTLIVLSAFLTIALYNIAAPNCENPLQIEVPEQLWALLGISATSLVGSPLVLSTKRDKKPIDPEVKAFKTRKEIPQASISAANDNIKKFGILDFNLRIEDAKFADMFMGDEMGNSGSIDIAKVQKFFFTLIIAFSYMLLLLQLIINATTTGLNSFPALDDSTVALLGISAAGYLTNKTYDKTQTEKPKP